MPVLKILSVYETELIFPYIKKKKAVGMEELLSFLQLLAEIMISDYLKILFKINLGISSVKLHA